jgi:hypothetical protein
MIERIRARLTYANVMATLAVFIALGGTAAASVIITSNTQVASNTISGHHPPSGKHANLIAGSVNAQDLANGAVTNGKLGARAVTSPKLGLNAVGHSQLAPNSVNSSNVQNGSLTGTDIDQSTLNFVLPSQLLRSGVQAMSIGETKTLIDTGQIALTGDCTSPSPGQAQARVQIQASGPDIVVFSADSDFGHTDGSDTGGSPVTIDQVSSASFTSDRGSFDAATATNPHSLDGQFLAVASGAGSACEFSAFGAAG